MSTRCRITENAFHRFILVNLEQESLAWSGSRWVPVDQNGFPAGDVQVSNFETPEEAEAEAKRNGLIVDDEVRIRPYREKGA